MINEIQPKIKFQNIVQCPFKLKKKKKKKERKKQELTITRFTLLKEMINNQLFCLILVSILSDMGIFRILQ